MFFFFLWNSWSLHAFSCIRNSIFRVVCHFMSLFEYLCFHFRSFASRATIVGLFHPHFCWSCHVTALILRMPPSPTWWAHHHHHCQTSVCIVALGKTTKRQGAFWGCVVRILYTFLKVIFACFLTILEVCISVETPPKKFERDFRSCKLPMFFAWEAIQFSQEGWQII